mmetsp:Transcript_6423/g.7686  ORF Transcript_6423/g.7686 Transcript_6423/m.7686 type:complete len:87 (-) Transcript_6423:563-823(-)
MMQHKNPSITTNKKEATGPDHSFDLRDENFMLAFGLDSYTEGMKADKRFYKWVARFESQNLEFDYYPVYECTAEDLGRFFDQSESF